MKHVITQIIPDCPMCGAEMRIIGRMEEIITEHGKRHQMRQRWSCPDCGHAFPEENGRITVRSHEELLPVSDVDITE